MPLRSRILIVTAAFGEGHNSAARNLALALDVMGATTQVSDPCLLGAPRMTAVVNSGYRYVTTHLPQVWATIYRSTDRCDLRNKQSFPVNLAESATADLIREFQPDAIVSTYPLYPYLLTRILEKFDKKIPVFVVVTDSVEINSAWLRAECDRWLVTDSFTRDVMVRAGLPAEKVVETGFPVNPVFSTLTPVGSQIPLDTFRILYFPTSKTSLVLSHGKALLETSPRVKLTVVLGRNVRQLYPQARELKLAYPGRVRLIGWTRRVPQLLNTHHLVVGKAGGATVHEAIAARCPMIIHHLVPGQEEGNLRLLETLGAGHLAESPHALSTSLNDLLADHAAKWRAMKDALTRHNRNAGAITAATFILNQIQDTHSPS